MSEQVVDYALTTKARIKDKLGINVTNHDTVLDRLISSATDFIERYCGRRFKQATFTEYFDREGDTGPYLFLKQAPVASITSVSYRAGLPSNPNWTALTSDEYILDRDGSSGILRLYSLYYGTTIYKVVYVAGYAIDWANAGQNTHTLPFDISEACEELVVQMFKKREKAGVDQETFNGASVTWSKLVSDDIKAVLDQYTNIRFV